MKKTKMQYVVNPSIPYYFIRIYGKHDKEVIKRIVHSLCGFLTYVNFTYVGKGWIITMKRA